MDRASQPWVVRFFGPHTCFDRFRICTELAIEPADKGASTARKLDTLIYGLLRWGRPYVDRGAAAYESRYLQQRIRT
jgi:hypothetical protein